MGKMAVEPGRVRLSKADARLATACYVADTRGVAARQAAGPDEGCRPTSSADSGPTALEQLWQGGMIDSVPASAGFL